ncbi:MAG TPA: condensation domain-containing protein, partial [Spirochaetales bacterium]|nr:condensation domain-containing protein [Spirochaetales bacterium]
QTADRHALALTFHHIALDGWSLSQLLGELFSTYATLASGGRLPDPRPDAYGSYLRWLDSAPKDADFWRKLLDGAPRPAFIDSIRRPGASVAMLASGSGGSASKDVFLGADLSAGLRQAARDAGSTLSAVCKALWGILVASYTGVPDAVFGFIVSGRSAPVRGVDRAIGCMIANAPVRVTFDRSLSMAALAKRLHAEAPGLELNAHVPVSAMGVSGAPPFDHAIGFENYPGPGSAPDDARLRPVSFSARERAPFALNALLGDGPDLSLRLAYDPELILSTTIDALGARFVALAGAFVSDPEAPAFSLAFPEAQDASPCRAGPERRWPERTPAELVQEL